MVKGHLVRTVIYYRVSTKDQNLGIEAQRAAVAQHVARIGATVVREFTEKESGKIDARPELDKAIDLAKRERAVLTVAKLDRLSRNGVFLVNLHAALTKGGVEFCALDVPGLNTLMLFVMAGLAQHEREMISSRTKAALAALKAKGEPLGTARAVTKVRTVNGVQVGGGAVKMSAAEKAARSHAARKLQPLTGDRRALLVEALSQQRTLQGAADWLNDRGVPTSTGRGPWHPIQVHRVAKRLGLRAAA